MEIYKTLHLAISGLLPLRSSSNDVYHLYCRSSDWGMWGCWSTSRNIECDWENSYCITDTQEVFSGTTILVPGCNKSCDKESWKTDFVESILQDLTVC